MELVKPDSAVSVAEVEIRFAKASPSDTPGLTAVGRIVGGDCAGSGAGNAFAVTCIRSHLESCTADRLISDVGTCDLGNAVDVAWNVVGGAVAVDEGCDGWEDFLGGGVRPVR